MSVSSKKLVNSVERCVDEALEGFVAVNPGVQLLEGHRVVVRADRDAVVNAGKVTLLCGGGSGHEPAHAGFIGPGMLTAVVAGAVFASPPPKSILAALRTITQPEKAGSFVIVTNYTGDRLNFGLAVERGRQEGLSVDYVVVGEDCALTTSDKTAGRRGLTGTVLINKICGALAEEGKSLEEISTKAKDAAKNMGTIGVSLTPCSVPGSGPSFQLANDEFELGLGIHGEAGVKRTKLVSAAEVVKMMLDHMTDPKNSSHLKVNKGDKVACMINNLGGTSVLEMNIIAREAICQLEGRGVVVERAYCGSFMTSLEMAGVSITLLHLDDTLKRCLDAKTSAPAWPQPLLPAGQTTRVSPNIIPYTEKPSLKSQSKKTTSLPEAERVLLYNIIKLAAERLVSAESQLNELDRESGDGDCGSTLSRGAQVILEKLGTKEDPGLPVKDLTQLALALAASVEETMGGCSGALYSLLFTSASIPLQKGNSAEYWSEALQGGIQTIMRYGGAEPGDRTMLDALYPAGKTFSEQLSKSAPVEAFAAAVQAAEKGAEATTSMKARAGRSSYVSADHLTKPDPGAVGVTIWMKAVLEVLKS